MVAKFDRSLLPPFPDLQWERELWQAGIKWVAGVDEAGRGALAGPVAAAAVILPPVPHIQVGLTGVHDSKQMTPPAREYWAAQIKGQALAWGVGFASHVEIDEIGILPATRLAVERALAGLGISPQHLLLDFLNLPGCSLPQTPLVKGDARSLSIASASVLAKTARDRLMISLEAQYPGYGFGTHKGYGTFAHLACLSLQGPCAIHRRSFRPLAEKG